MGAHGLLVPAVPIRSANIRPPSSGVLPIVAAGAGRNGIVGQGLDLGYHLGELCRHNFTFPLGVTIVPELRGLVGPFVVAIVYVKGRRVRGGDLAIVEIPSIGLPGLGFAKHCEVEMCGFFRREGHEEEST